MTQFKKGDILVKREQKRKVLEVLGDLVFIIHISKLDTSIRPFIQKELIDNGWKLEEKEWTPEMNKPYFFPHFGSSDKYNSNNWINDTVDNNLKNSTGVFQTKEEAIARYEEIIKSIKK